MKYVKYKLKMVDGEGVQPYVKVFIKGASLDGGIICDIANNEYFGYLYGTNDECQGAIDNCNDYFMQELTVEEALNFWLGIIPKNSLVLQDNGYQYSGEPYIDSEGRVRYDLFEGRQ